MTTMTDELNALNKEADPYRWTRKAMKVLIDQQAEIAKLKSALEAHRIWHLEVDAEIKYLKESGGQRINAVSTQSIEREKERERQIAMREANESDAMDEELNHA